MPIWAGPGDWAVRLTRPDCRVTHQEPFRATSSSLRDDSWSPADTREAASSYVTLQPADAYSSSLPLSGFAMSEAANLSGGKLTYLDGHVQNTGGRTVTGATVQVVFQNDEGLAPQIDTVPLTLIRMKEPYIDTEPIGADPLKPGDDREFRLTFETVPDNWNTQMPEVRLIHTDLR